MEEVIIKLVLIRGGEKAGADQQNPEPAENSTRLLLVATPPSSYSQLIRNMNE